MSKKYKNVNHDKIGKKEKLATISIDDSWRDSLVFNGYKLDYVLKEGKPYFPLSMIGKMLNIKNPHMSINTKDTDYVVKIKSSSEGFDILMKIHNRGQLFVSEAGLYRLILASRTKNAEKFSKWVTMDVLPAIRQQGYYSSNIPSIPHNFADAISLVNYQAQQIDEMREKIKHDEPKVTYAETVLKIDNAVPLSYLSKLLSQEQIMIGRNKLFEYLREKKYIYKDKNRNVNMPYQKYVNKGYFRLSEHVKSNAVSYRVLVTSKGRIFFLNLLKNEFADHKLSGITTATELLKSK